MFKKKEEEEKKQSQAQPVVFFLGGGSSELQVLHVWGILQAPSPNSRRNFLDGLQAIDQELEIFGDSHRTHQADHLRERRGGARRAAASLPLGRCSFKTKKHRHTHTHVACPPQYNVDSELIWRTALLRAGQPPLVRKRGTLGGSIDSYSVPWI